MAIVNLEEIEKKLHLEQGSLKSAMESEDEVTLEIPSLVIRTDEDEKKYVDNLQKEFFEKNGAAAEVAEKRAVLKVSESLGVDLEGKAKTVNNFASAFKEKVEADAKVEPNEALKKIKADFSQLQENYNLKEKELNSFKKESEQKEHSFRERNDVMSMLPKKDTKIPAEDMFTIFKSRGYALQYENGNTIVTKNGKELKNTTNLDPLPLQDVVNSFSQEYIVKKEGGRGEGDDSGAAVTGTADAFIDEMKAKGIKPGSMQFQEEMQQRIKAGTLKS